LDTKSKNTIPNKDRIPPKPEQEGDWSEWDRAMEQDELIETGRTYSHWMLKVLAIVACVIAVCYVLRGTVLWGFYGDTDAEDYFQSESLSASMTDTVRQAISLFFYYVDEAATQSGTSPAGVAREERLSRLFAQYESERTALSESVEDPDELKSQLSALFEEYEKQYASIVNADKEAIAALVASLDASAGVYIASVSKDGAINANFTPGDATPEGLRTFFESLPAAAYIGAGYFGNLPENAVALSDTSMVRDIPADSAFYAGYSAARFSQMKGEYDTARATAKSGPSYLFWGGMFALASLVWLVFTAGKSANYDGVRPVFVDRVYTDVLGLITVIGVTICFQVLGLFSRLGYSRMTDFALGVVDGGTLLTVYTPVSAATLLCVMFLMSCARKVKAHKVLRHSLTGIALRRLAFLVRSAVRGLRAGPLARRTTVATLAYVSVGLAAAGIGMFLTARLDTLGAVVGVALFICYCLWLNHRMVARSRDLERIVDDIRRIGAGELSHRAAASQASEFRGLVDGVNDIAKGLEVSLFERVRAERMKTELITNVSHDLRTPLTGLITYVDLLKKEGLSSPNAPEYLAVLDKKSQRLKTLTDDLFEAAKAASGTLPVQAERIDLCSLVSQGLAEIADRIEASGLTVVTELPSERVFALADGRRLWRAVQNLLSNALNYSLPGTRVFVSAGYDDQKDMVFLSVKNISKEPIGSGERLSERFYRGDSARHSEGSGLGLAISRSLCELMKGELILSADGDLFKATVLLPPYPAEDGEDAQQNQEQAP
jgi:signal transduction histidine kinase